MLILNWVLVCAVVVLVVILGVTIAQRLRARSQTVSIEYAAQHERGKTARMLTGAPGQAPTAAPDDVWEMLLLATPGGAPSRLLMAPWNEDGGPPTGRTLSASSPIARGLRDLLLTTKASSSLRTLSTAASGMYFRFDASPELLRGIQRGLYEVMPATTGGLRSAVRSAAGKKIVGHGQFVSTITSQGGGSGASVAVGAVGVAAAPALAPVILVAAITAAMEMAAAAEQKRQLKAIHNIVAALHKRQMLNDIAMLDAGALALQLSAAALMDSGTIPTALGLDHHAAQIATAWQASRQTLENWQVQLHKLPSHPTPNALVEAFPGIEDLEHGEFWRELALARARLALHGRATLLAAAQAARSDPDNPYATFRRSLEGYTAELQTASDGLRDFAADLASRQIRVGTMTTGGTANQVIALTHRLNSLADDLRHPKVHQDLPAAIGPGGVLEVEGIRHADGSVTLLAQPDQLSAAAN